MLIRRFILAPCNVNFFFNIRLDTTGLRLGILKTSRAPCAFFEEMICSREGDDGALRPVNFRANPMLSQVPTVLGGGARSLAGNFLSSLSFIELLSFSPRLRSRSLLRTSAPLSIKLT